MPAYDCGNAQLWRPVASGHQEALHRGPEVGRPHRPPVGVAQPGAQREDVGLAVVARFAAPSWRGRRRECGRPDPRRVGKRQDRRRRASRAAPWPRWCRRASAAGRARSPPRARMGGARAASHPGARSAGRPPPPTPSRLPRRSPPDCSRSRIAPPCAARPGPLERWCRPRRPPPTPRPLPPPRPSGPCPPRPPTTRGSSTGSIRDSVPSWRLTTQTAPSPNASALGPLPTRIGGRMLRVRGSIRVTVPDSSLATHSAPPPAAIADGFAPTGIDLLRRPLREIDTADAPIDSRRDPHHAVGEGQRARHVAHLVSLRRPCWRPGRSARRSRESLSATHSEPPPNASAAGAPPTEILTA